MGLRQSFGAVNFLLINEVGGGFGPPGDFIDAEVVVKIDSDPNLAVGFQLRNDGNRPVRQGMLDLLRDAFESRAQISLDYFLDDGKFNGVVNRVALRR